jgi:hypothetical protein
MPFPASAGSRFCAAQPTLRYNHRLMEDREIIVGLLRAVARRMRITRVLQEVGFAACVVLFALVAFRLVQPRLDGALGGLDQPILIAGLAAFCAYILYQALKGVPISRAASLTDSRLPLHDELKSAYWFASRPEATAFVRAHIANAARTAQRLSGATVMPLRLPRNMLVAGLLGLMLIAAMWSRSDLVRAGTASGSQVTQPDVRIESARALLAATAADEEEIKQLDLALSVFEQGDATRQELQEAMVDARGAVDQVNMQASVAREGLAKLARAMRGHPELEQIAAALEQGRTTDAIAMLQQLREDLSQKAGEDDGAEQSGVARTKESDTDLGQAIGQTARDLSRMPGGLNDETLNRLLENLEDADESIEMQTRTNATESRMGEMETIMIANTEGSELPPAGFGDEGARPTATPSPDTGNTDLRGGTMFRQGAMTPGDADKGDDGSTTGSPSGDSASLALEGRATRRLDAQLEQKRVRVGSGDDTNAEDGGDESAWFYSASQQQASESALVDVRAHANYERADVVGQGRTPIQQRKAVRDYFINVHKGDEQ